MAETYVFPSKTIKDKLKNEDWHRDYVLAIMSQTLGGGWFSMATSSIEENYNIYNSMESGEEFNFLQESEDGESLPAIWMNYNTIRKRIHAMIGDLISKGFDINVKSINKDAVTRKMKAKAKIFAKMRMKDVNAELAEMSGIAMAEEEFMPESLDELETYMNARYKDNTELIMEYALKYSIELYKWKYKRLQAFRDVMVAGRCFGKSEIRNGYPNMRVLDPRFVVFDPYASDDFISDASYFGEIRYMSFEDAAEQYDVTKEELKELYNDSEKGISQLYWQGALSVSSKLQTFIPFTEVNGGTRVLVFSAEWLDYKTVKYKRSVDKHGNEHFKLVDSKTKGNDIIEKVISTARQGTLVGGDLMKEWGEAKNITRDIDNPSVTRLSYVSLLPNYVNYKSVSKVDEMKGLQKLKDIALYRLQLEMTTAGRKGFAYDMSMLPEGMPYERVMYYLKVSGIAFYDSQREGIPSQGNPFTQFDGSITNSVMTYVNISEYLDNQMDEVSGINAARTGSMLGASQAVGVTNSALMQSNVVTATYYKLFEQWEERLFQKHADLIKIAWKGNRDKFAPILGEAGIDFLSNDTDVDLDDYAIFVKPVPAIFEDKQRLEQMIMAALQAGQLSFKDALILLGDDDIKMATRKFIAITDRREAAEAQQAQQQQEIAMQAQQAQQAQDTQAKLAISQADNDGKTVLEQIKSERDSNRTAMKNEHDKRKQELDIEKELLIKELDAKKGL